MTIQSEWTALDNKRGSLIIRCEQYADVTLPYVFARDIGQQTELQGQLDSTGARAVNFLTNKLVLTLFPENQPFFRLQIASDIAQQMTKAAKEGDEEAAMMLKRLDTELAAKEREAIQALMYPKFRTEAISAVRLLIITGNACMYHPRETGSPQVYNLRDYVVQRDLAGVILKIITRDKKAFSTFAKDVQAKIQAGRKQKYKGTEDITVYTKVELKDGKYHLSQEAGEVDLEASGVFTADDLPWKVLSWNHIRGEDYGHGLVEDHFGSMHALAMLTKSLIEGVAAASEIKFLVEPTSLLDVKQLNESRSGSYHTGKKDDVTCVQLNKALDFQMVITAIERLERQIAAVFLMNSAVTRDAERVTAEEIRYVAQELELAHAGVYSKLAQEWQYPTAVLLLKRVGATVGEGTDFVPQIITGIDALSRAGDLDNFRAFITDLSMLNNLPEQIVNGFDVLNLIEFLSARRGVEYMKFAKTPAQLQAEQQAMMLQQQQLMASQAGVDVAAEAGKATVRGS